MSAAADTGSTQPTPTELGALLAGPGRRKSPTAENIAAVAKAHGTSPLKQMRQIFAARRGAGKLTVQEYYANRLYRPELDAETRAQYVGERGSLHINNRLSPRGLTRKRPFVRDKVIYNAMMEALGFPVTVTQALVSPDRSLGDIPALRSADELEAFLRTRARYPLFAKPEVAWGSIGSALITGLDPKTGILSLANGREVEVGRFAAEAFASYGYGLILQDAVIQHPEVEARIGKPVGTLRLCTVIEEREARVLYALWKIPSPSAMSDNYWQDGSIIAALDHDTGTVTRVQRGGGLQTEELENHPVSGAQLRGWTVPNWDHIVETACRGHEVLPEFGVFGWDIAIGPEGAVIVECNENPHHGLYQLAFDRPAMNPAFAQAFERIAARGARLEKAAARQMKALEKQHWG